MKTSIIRRIGTAALALTLTGLAGLALHGGQAKAADEAGGRFTLSSLAFKDGGNLPSEFTCDGERASPPLEWSNPPAGTRSFAVTMHHIPGPGDEHVYLVIYTLPADTHALAKNAKDVGLFGINTVNGQQEYTPPCSKGLGPKKYTLTVYALSAEPKFSVRADAVTMDLLLDAIKQTTLGTAEINVTYSRTGKTPAAQAADAAPAGQNANGPQDQNGPPGADDRGPGGSGGSGGVGGPPDDRRPGPPELRAIESLRLTDEQKQQVDPILRDFHEKQDKLREELLKQLKDVMNPEQYEKFESAFKRPPPPPRPPQTNRDGVDPATNPPASPAPALAAAPGVAVTFTGGYETDPRDGGRPVVLIAAALKVPANVFRKAFSNVKPARGGQEPDLAQVSKNKQTLMSSLGPYGVTNERLDTVSNYYRYRPGNGELWRHTPATAYATIQNGVVTAVTIVDPGSGYSSPPTISIPGIANANLTATLSFGDDFAKNGSIKEIAIAAPAAPSPPR